jgi:hypothetical protein
MTPDKRAQDGDGKKNRAEITRARYAFGNQ